MQVTVGLLLLLMEVLARGLARVLALVSAQEAALVLSLGGHQWQLHQQLLLQPQGQQAQQQAQQQARQLRQLRLRLLMWQQHKDSDTLLFCVAMPSG